MIELVDVDRIVIRQTEGNALDEDALAIAVQQLRAGATPPPIAVQAEGERFVIVDGRHRFVAQVITGRSAVRCRVGP